MAYIKTLKDNELIGGQDNTDVYPVTTSQAIFRQKSDGSKPEGVRQRLEDTLQDHEDDAALLHRESERLVPYITGVLKESTATKTSPLEINGNVHTWELMGSAQIETYGDEPSKAVLSADMDYKGIQVTRDGESVFIGEGITEADVVIPDTVGTYTAVFTCSYNNTRKSVSSTINVNLRKYFGFSDEQPSDVTALGTSHFSNSVGCTVTIPAGGTGFKHIWFAVPADMEITRIVQPDALNAPLDKVFTGTVDRIINGVSYPYKLYMSTDLIDSSLSKRLTIS